MVRIRFHPKLYCHVLDTKVNVSLVDLNASITSEQGWESAIRDIFLTDDDEHTDTIVQTEHKYIRIALTQLSVNT